MAGHGTLTSGADAEGDGEGYVSNNGGSTNYPAGEIIENVYNATGGAVVAGDVVILDWDATNSRVEATQLGTRAVGNVSAAGDTITITTSGDTGLDGTVNISTEYGDNSGFEGQEDVSCGNVNGEAAYLS